jgi:tetratricopeptide (TPR) repeat protein
VECLATLEGHLHTRIVRRFVFALVVLAALRGEAKPEVVATPMAPPVDPDRGNFWREITEPHKEEVNVILFKAKQAINQADNSLAADYDPTGEGRQKIYREVNGMLRYARRLAPDNLEVLKLYGQTSDAIGKTRQAMEVFQSAIDQVGPEKAGIEITGRLGEIYLRLGQLDDAIRYLRIAQGPIVPGQPITGQILVHLSSALAQRGLASDAIEVLSNALPTNPPYYSNEMQVVAFALAVMYDRDEQRTAAFETLDHLRAALQDQLGPMVQNALATLRYAPAEDEQYYLGLLYEATDSYAEARVEFALYAAAGDLMYRRRALDHIAAIDARPRVAPLTPKQLRLKRLQLLQPVVPVPIP